MNNFIEDFEKDLDREMFIGGYRALLSMNSYIKQTEDYVDDFDAIFSDIFINGTINGTVLYLMEQGTLGASVNSWLIRINEESAKLNINVQLIANNVTVQHVSPWHIEILLNTTVNITDVKGLASWTFEKQYTKTLSILGFEDPLYIVGTEDKVTNLINITPNLDFVNETNNNDTTVLKDHLSNSYYVNVSIAPSFLMRFTGDLSASPYGIESMVNLEDLNAQNIPILARSLIDYIYFGSQVTTNYCNVSEVPEWFRIDNSNNHLEFYEVENLSKQLC